MTTALSGMNCSIASKDGDISKATAARRVGAGFLSAAMIVVDRAATRHVTATGIRVSSAHVRRFMRVRYSPIAIAMGISHCHRFHGGLKCAGAEEKLDDVAFVRL